MQYVGRGLVTQREKRIFVSGEFVSVFASLSSLCCRGSKIVRSKDAAASSGHTLTPFEEVSALIGGSFADLGCSNRF